MFGEKQKRLDEIEEEIMRLKKEASEIKNSDKQYFIGVVAYGNGDYWDEYYTRLGFITRATAEKWLERELDHEGTQSYDSCVFSVDLKKYNAYSNYRHVKELLRDLEIFKNQYCEDVFDNAICFLENKARGLNEQFDLVGEYDSFRHVVDDDIQIDEESN